MRTTTFSPYYYFLEQKIKSFCILFGILGIVACGGGGGGGDEGDDDSNRGANDSDTTAPVIALVGDETVTITEGSTYADAGATATDNVDGTITGSIVKTSTVNSAVVGSYLVTYTVSDEAGNEATTTRTVVVEAGAVVDSTAPVITVVGNQSITIEVGSVYTDVGATATDDVSGDLTSAIATSSTVNSAVVGSYLVTYTVSDAAGNEATAMRTVVVEAGVVVDTTAPVITIVGNQSVTIEVGSAYTDDGATATDAVSGALTSAIATTSNVNSAVVGFYVVTYTVSDAAGNEATATRTVTVEDTVTPDIVILGDSPATVELGFDYSDAGATASDIGDGDLSADIETTGTVDTSQLGFYSIVYSVSDSSGNTATETRSVEVYNTLPTSLNQAAFNASSGDYEHGHNSILNIMISGAPADTDRSRWAMLHDNVVEGDAGEFRLYFFKKGSNDTFYQFAYNPSTGVYQWGYESIATLNVTGMPNDADSSSFAMLHDGFDYRLYMQSKTTNSIHQASFNAATNNYEYGLNSINQITITGGPADTDFSRWAMLHDGGVYRFYAFKAESATSFYQFGFNPSTGRYEHGHLSIPELEVVNMPSSSDRSDFSMLHDGGDYRFYFLNIDG